MKRLGGSTKKVLIALYDAYPDETWGYAVSKATGLTGGSLYPVFERLREAGLVVTDVEKHEKGLNRPPRKFYKLSPDGLAYCAERLELPGKAIGGFQEGLA